MLQRVDSATILRFLRELTFQRTRAPIDNILSNCIDDLGHVVLFQSKYYTGWSEPPTLSLPTREDHCVKTSHRQQMNLGSCLIVGTKQKIKNPVRRLTDVRYLGNSNRELDKEKDALAMFSPPIAQRLGELIRDKKWSSGGRGMHFICRHISVTIVAANFLGQCWWKAVWPMVTMLS